jgi:amino acid adenylation domain-containing protein
MEIVMISDELKSLTFTSCQKEIWLSSQASASDYNEIAIMAKFRISNKLCPEILQKSIDIALQQNPLLGCSLYLNERNPYFDISRCNGAVLDFFDVSSHHDPSFSAQKYLDEFFEKPVDKNPSHFALIHTGQSESIYAIKFSHLVLDGLASFFHVDFIADIYSSLTHGKDFSIEDSDAFLKSHAQDKKHFESPKLASDLKFWKNHLEAIPEKRIFRALPGHADVLGHSRHKKFVLPENVSESIKVVMRKHAVGPAAYFAALHALIVSFMCDEKQIAIQTPIAFGERKSIRKRQGAQIATPSVFLDLGRHDTFESVMRDVGTQSMAFFRHVRTPYQLAMRELSHKNFAFVADTFVNFLPSMPTGNPDFHVLTAGQHHSDREPILFGILILQESEVGGYSLTVRSSCNHFSERDVERYVRRLEYLAIQLEQCSDLSSLDYLLAEEKQELSRWQRGERRKYANRPIPELFDDTVLAFRDAPAVRDESGAVLTYAELQERSLRCASWFLQKGVGKEDIVAVLAKRTIALPEIILGIMRIGAVYLPLDPKSPAERIGHIVSDAQAAFTIDPDDMFLDDAPCSETFARLSPGDAAYVIYTSGSTGKPKGVVVPHDGFVNMIQGQIEIFGLSCDDRVLQFASPAFDASLSEIFMVLLSGACLYPVTDKYRHDPWALKKYMEKNAVSVATFPPSYLHLFDKDEISGLRVLITAGEPPIARDALHYATRLHYFNAYGPTEACVCASIKRVLPGTSLPISSGTPIPNVNAYILSLDKSPLPAGMIGELHIGGASPALGYHGNTEMTQSRFQTLPWADGERVYATGDLASWSEDGEIVLAGRTDDQVKIRGNRVELGEVTFLLEKCEAVSQAFVLATRDASDQPTLAAFLVLHGGGTVEAVVGWSKENLPAYMIPSIWRQISAMPVTVTGKINRDELLRIARDKSSFNAEKPEISPELLEICERVLGKPYAPDQDFFVQGGNSLKAMTLLHEIRGRCRVEISFRDFVKCANLYDVATLLRDSEPQASSSRCDRASLSRGQFQLWAYQQANEGTVDYNMPFLMEVKGERAQAFVDALCRALKDQELFSCTLGGEIDNPFFLINEAAQIPVRQTDFKDSLSAQRYFGERIHTPFDLRTELPVRVEVARLAGSLQVLLLVHHIAGDAESIEILLNNALQHVRGGEASMGFLATQAEFCRREDAYLRSAEFKADQAYWDRVFAPPATPLHPSPRRKGAMAAIELPPDLQAGLQRLAEKAGTTLLCCFATLLGGFLRKRHGRREILVGVPVGLRETQAEFDTVGFYVRTVALRLQEYGGEGLVPAVRAAAAQFKEAISHSRCGSPVTDILATHAHVKNFEARGLAVHALEPELKASKFTGSFLLETGVRSRIVLEYDELFFRNGQSLLEAFITHIATECGDVSQRGGLQVLADAWTTILGSEAGDGSEFFMDGGDSIKAIQIVGLLHRGKVTGLSAADFLRTPRFSDLCRLLEEIDDSPDGQAPGYAPVAAGQRVPLLPLQSFFLRSNPKHWKSFFMSLPMEIGPSVDRAKIEDWLGTLPGRYEALRLSFADGQAVVLQDPQTVVLTSCAFAAESGQRDALREVVRTVVAGLDPELGATLGAGLAELDSRRLLVFVGHHLVLDAVSLDVLRQDLIAFCRGEERPGEAHGVATRAAEVRKLVDEGTFPTLDDHEFWKAVCATGTGALHALHDDRRDLASERGFTLKQLQGFRPDYARSVRSELLWSLSVALHAQGQRETVFVTLESHGRDTLLPGFDMSRSLGWFTAVCPLPLRPAATVEDAEQGMDFDMGRFLSPLSCNAYGYLRDAYPEVFTYDSQISFNYFGRFFTETGQDFTPLPVLAMPGNIPELLHPDFEPESPLELVVFFDESGALNLGAYFSAQVLSPDWVEGLLDSWMGALRTLPACIPVLPEDVREKIREISCCEDEDIDDILPPDATHEPMLYQYLSADRSVYAQQIEFHFKGPIDDFLLLKAWTKVVSRHESLRSLFPMPVEGEFYRLVLRKARATTGYSDLSHLPPSLAMAKKDELLATERTRGFDLNTGPLLRMQLYRLGGETFVLSWCCHHLLMDGWCIGILLGELFTVYDSLENGSRLTLPDPVALSGYRRWHARYDENSARKYWEALLEGFGPLTGICTKMPSGDVVDPVAVELVLDADLSRKLRMVANSRSVTLPVLIQSLWAIVLSAENGLCRDVVYGVVTSGRPADLAGIDRAVGLFIQTLPLRARWAQESSFGELLNTVKDQGLNQMRHGYLPLAEIGRDLFDHLMVFENYPFETRLRDGQLELLGVHGFEKIPYPLGISVIPGDRIRFRFLYDPSRMEPERVGGLSDRLHALMRVLSVDEEVSCRVLAACLDGAATVRTGSCVNAPVPWPNRPVADFSKFSPAAHVPNDDIEGVLLEIYGSVLKCTVPSPEADFFQLGGHSLLAMRVLAQVSKRFSVQVTIEDILSHPNVRALAGFVRSASFSSVNMPQVAPRNRFPLSAGQRRIWFLQRLHGDSLAYQIPFAARIGIPVDTDALQKALFLLESRHDALRLRVFSDEPEQMLVLPGSLKLECMDRPWSAERLADEAMDFGPEEALIRVSLFHDSASGDVLLLRFHHIIFDGWSAEIFLRELNQAYAAVLSGSSPDWQSLDLDYASYVDWERKQEFTGLEVVARNLLPLPESLKLPLDYPRPAKQSFEGAVVVFDLDAKRSQGLKSCASQLGVTLFPVLLALVKTFLYRHTGQTDLVVGCPAANRESAQVQNMIGLFVNTLAVRTTLRTQAGFEALVRDVQGIFQHALAAQSCPFEKVLDELALDRNLARNPMFDVFVALEDADWSNYGQKPLHMQPLDLPHARSKFDLSFYFKERQDGSFAVHMEYCTALFTEETVRFMSRRFLLLLDEVLRGEDVPLSDLGILPPDEQARIDAFNNTAEPFDIQDDVDGRFRAQVRRSGGAVALEEVSGRSCTYDEMDAKVSALAVHLKAAGLSRGDYAGVCFERSLEMMVAIFAVLRVGATYVPLSATLPEDRLRSIFEDLGRCVVISGPGFAEKFSGLGQSVLTPDMSVYPARDFEAACTGPDGIAYVIFTSGSTGRPKGVPIKHRSLINRILWMQSRFPIGEDDVILQKTTVSFDVSVWELFWWSWVGARLALLEPNAEKNPGKIVEAIHAHKVTVLHFVPSMLRAFLDHLESRPQDAYKLASLRYVFTSGETLTSDLVTRFKAALSCELHNLYGPTEATIDVSWYPCREHAGSVVPIGRPVSNTRLHVLDGQGRRVPIGVVGELFIGGVQVAPGYVNRPDLTAVSFLPDPFHPGDRMYRTGDLGRWLPDGNVEYLGRNDDQVKIRGYRIELGEVEGALSRCPGVSQAVVRVARIGEYDALEAFLLPHPGKMPVLSEIWRELGTLLPDYMWPSIFRVMDEIPLGPSGKADRKRLQGRRLASEPRGVGEVTALQEEIRGIWHEVMPELEILDIDQGFFEVGGNSLLLVKLHALLDLRWKDVFTLAGLFSESTIREQAEHIAKIRKTAESDLPKAAYDAPVAIIGMAVRLGDYEDLESFWADLAQGVDKTMPLPARRQSEVRQIFEAVGFAFDAARLREASYLSDISSFDYKRFGMSPGDAAMLEPRQRIFLETALQALDDAGYGGASLENRNVGTFVGASPYRLFQDAVTRAFPDQAEQTYLLNVPSNVVGRISYLKNWTGAAATIDTACSSVLTAIHDACHALRTGENCVTLVGGAHIIDLPVKGDATFTIESGSGRTRSFDAKADGVGAGEGAAVFVLKLLEQALRDNDPIHAVIVGSAINQDGKSSSMAAPNPGAQAEVIVQAARSAGLSLTEMDFFEAHGTGTVLGDPVEVEGLTQAFAREGKEQAEKALIGSVKGNIGHLDAAAGALGLAKAVMSLKKGFVPPQPHFETPNPHIDFAVAPVRVARTLEPLPRSGRPLAGGVSSFGLSGVNAHVVVREHVPSDLPKDDGTWHCIPLSAANEDDLKKYRLLVRDVVARNTGWPLHAVAGTLVAGREHLEVRTVMVASSREELLDQLGGELTSVRVSRLLKTGLPGAAFQTRAQAEEAGMEFLRGQRLVWPEDRILHRVHLPATPFSRSTLWPRFKTAFLSGPVATPAGTAFSVSLGRPDFWPVAEHVLGGVPTLVGMGAVELICEAVKDAPPGIENLVWHRPVSWAEGDQAVLLLEEMDKERVIRLQHFHAGKWHVAVSAKVLTRVTAGVHVQPPRIDIVAIRDAMQAFEGGAGQSIISISRRWDCREALWVSDGGRELLSRLTLPDEFRQDLSTFKWHPAMLDLAASLALHEAAGFVPARCDSIRLHKPLPTDIFAHVVVQEKGAQIISADCTITDLSGNVLLEMRGLVFLSLLATRSVPELYEIQWAAAELPVLESDFAQGGKTLLLGGTGDGVCDALAEVALLRRDLSELPEERKMLAGEILESGVSHIIYLPSPGNSHWAFCSQLQELCRAGLHIPLHVTVVGNGVFANHAEVPSDALAHGMLLALKQEEPLLDGAYVELEAVTAASVRALKEILGRIDGACLIKGDGSVCLQELAKVPVSPDIRAMRGCVVVSGGLGGMALTLAEWIEARTDARVVLLHRKAQKDPGLPFASYCCDVNDNTRVREVLAEIRRDLGPISGVIHAAGVAGDGFLLTKKQETYGEVLAPKVTGTWNLHEATLHDDLDFFVLASSRTSLVGAPGQSDYTAANAYLNAFALYRRAHGLPALAICWNAWAKVGMAARMNADIEGFSLAPEQAFGVLCAALSSGAPLVAVAMSDEDVSRYRLSGLSLPKVESNETRGHFGETEILHIFRDCLGYEEELSREDDFFDFGGDSISGTRIVARIRETLGVSVSVMDLLESQTIGEFMDGVLAKVSKGDTGEQDMTPAPERDKYPVGREQLSILYADLLSDEHTGYNLPLFLELPRDLDRKRLEEALGELIRRHEVLRTSFCDFDEEHPNMIIHPFEGFELEEMHCDLARKDALIKPFNLKKGELFRVKLLVAGQTEFVLFMDIHHALADGRTISLLNAELYRLYHGLELEPVALQQKDFAWHQYTHPNDDDRKYWLTRFDSNLPQTDLPADFTRPSTHTNRGGVHEFELPVTLVSGIKDLARREGLTNYHIVLSAWSILVHSYTGAQDFVIAITVDSRERHLNTAGMLASLIPLRLSVDSGKLLRDVLKDNQKVSNEALKHKSYILNNLLSDLHPPLCLDRTLLSEIILSYMNFEFGKEKQGLFETLRFKNPASKADLSIFGSDSGDRISFALEYYADLFSLDTIAGMSEDFMRILELMVSVDINRALDFKYSPRRKKAEGSVQKNLGAELSGAIGQFARKKNTPVSTVLFTTFGALLCRVTAQSEIVVDFDSTRPVAFCIDQDTEFEDLLCLTAARVATAQAGATQAEDAKDAATSADIAFTFRDKGDCPGMPADDSHGLRCFAAYDAEGIVLRFDYDPAFLPTESALNWLHYYELFLQGIVQGSLQ